MTTKLFTVFIFSLFLLFACEKEISLGDDDFQPVLVINSLMDTSSFIQVQVSKTSRMNDTTSPLLNGADVELWENGVFAEKLDNTDEGIYLSSFKPKIGLPYKLIVSYPGFETVSVKDTIPKPVQLTDATIIVTATHDVEDPVHEVTVSFDDPENEHNYYEIIIKEKSYLFDDPNDTLIIDFNEDTTIYTDIYTDVRSDDPVLIAEGDMDYKPRSVYFSDKLFNGQKTSITIQFVDWNVETQYYLSGDTGYHFETIAVLRSVSYAYYKYKKTWWQHLYNQGVDLDIDDTDELRAFLFTGEPVNLYNNVENGYGIFAGFSESSLVIRKIN